MKDAIISAVTLTGVTVLATIFGAWMKENEAPPPPATEEVFREKCVKHGGEPAYNGWTWQCLK